MKLKEIRRAVVSSLFQVVILSCVCCAFSQEEVPQGFPTTPISPVLNSLDADIRASEGNAKKEPAKPWLDPQSTSPVILATWKNGGVWTSADLSATLQVRRPRAFAEHTASEVLALPGSQLRLAIEQLLFNKILTQKALDEGFTSMSTEVRAPIEEQRRRIFLTLYKNREIDPLIKKQIDAAAKEIYERDKDTKYSFKKSAVIKEIWLPYMKSYKVNEGDTWTSIAKNICGNESAVSQFLRDDGVRFLRVPEGLPSTDARPGEHVLIPMKHEETVKILAKGEKLRKALMEGSDWDKLASENESQALPGEFTPDLKGMNAKIVQAVNALTKDAISPLVETSSGVHLFKSVVVESTGTATFDEVRSSIEVPEAQIEKIVEKTRKELFDKLRAKYPIKLREDYLRRIDFRELPDPLPVETVIAEADGIKVTIEDLLKELASQQKTWKQLTPDERIKAVLSSEMVMSYLVVRDAQNLGYDTNEADVRTLRDSADEALSILEFYRLQAKYANPTEVELRKYWEENPLKFSQPERVTLHEITRRVNLTVTPEELKKQVEKAKKELSYLRGKITDLSSFEKAARENSQAISTRSRGGALGLRLADFRGDDFRKEVSKLKVGEVSEPFLCGNDVMIVRLDDRETSGAEPFEKCQNRVVDEWRKDKAQTLERELRDIVFKEYEVDIKVR